MSLSAFTRALDRPLERAALRPGQMPRDELEFNHFFCAGRYQSGGKKQLDKKFDKRDMGAGHEGKNTFNSQKDTVDYQQIIN